MKFIFFGAALFVLCQACGSRDVDVVYDKQAPAESYSFADFQAKCFTCHPGSAPAIPGDEAGFRAAAKVKARIENGSMPPSKEGFDKAKALAFFSKEEKPSQPTGGY